MALCTIIDDIIALTNSFYKSRLKRTLADDGLICLDVTFLNIQDLLVCLIDYYVYSFHIVAIGANYPLGTFRLVHIYVIELVIHEIVVSLA